MKLVFLCRRRPDITHDRYAALLLEGHVPLALRHHPTMRRYVVNLVDEPLGGAPALDSVGALWFDTLADFRERLYDSEEGRRRIGADVAGFMGGADAYATREYVLRAPGARLPTGVRSAGTKLVLALARDPEDSRDGSVATWLERRAPLALARPGVRGYAASVVEEALDGAPAADGFAEVWLDEPAAVPAVLALHPGARAWRVAEYVQR